MIDENKISTLKTKINTLVNVLKKCEFDKAKLEAMFSKKIFSKRHIQLHMLTLLNHTLSMLIFHMLIIHIMHLCMGEFIHILIVAERVTWLNFVFIV